MHKFNSDETLPPHGEDETARKTKKRKKKEDENEDEKGSTRNEETPKTVLRNLHSLACRVVVAAAAAIIKKNFKLNLHSEKELTVT